MGKNNAILEEGFRIPDAAAALGIEITGHQEIL